MSGDVELFAGDSMHERARKIWGLLGFVNDRLGQIDRLAGYLYAYQEIDRIAAGQLHASRTAPLEPEDEA